MGIPTLQKRVTRWASLAAIGVVLYGCGKNEAPIPPVTYGMRFYPITIGSYVDYRVDTSFYNRQATDTLVKHSYQLRMAVADTFSTGGNYIIYRINQTVRADSSQDWLNYKTSLLKVVDGLDIVSEQKGIESLLLRTPFLVGATWDYARYDATNNAGPRQVKVQRIGQETISNISVDSVAAVAAATDSNCITSSKLSYGLAAGKGLVRYFREDASFVADPTDPCPAQPKDQTRKRIEMRYLGMGRL